MKVIILGKAWDLIYKNIKDKQTEGSCDAPDTPNKKIIIDKRLKGIDLLDTELHEFEHAADWQKCEEVVAQKMTDIAKILWRLGYRKLNKNELEEYDKRRI